MYTDPITDREKLSYSTLDDGYWDKMIIDYLNTFQALHQLDSRLRVHLTPGYYLQVHHYCPGVYNCTLSTNGSPLLSKIYSLR